MDLSPSVYIPMDRRHALARGAALPTRATGAALFADISGFTPLTETLAQELGPKRGADELTKQLNRIYGALTERVNWYRGSVISFSGDAITCWFEADDGQRATTCALAMQQVMRALSVITTPSGAIVTLAIKVAVVSGAARRFQVGDPNIQFIDTLAGTTLDRLADAEQHARKGEVMVSAEVVAALGDALEVEAAPAPYAPVARLVRPAEVEGWPALPAALDEEQIRPWLLPEVYERVQAGEEEFLAELRPAVTVFVRFGGIDYDADDAAQDKLDAYVRWAQNVVARHEGALLQLTIGDKGAYIYCAFGAPLAHDNDAERAVAAALELRQPPAELNYITPAQIGASWGRIWAGPYGGPTRRTYGILGDEVNLAARLMSKAAPGQILLSPRIAKEIETLYDLRPLGPVTVKGKQAPIEITEVLERRAAHSAAGLYTSPLVGREPELRQMMHALDEARAGRGQIFRVAGAAGVGKSHLAAELMARAEQHRMGVAVGVCQSTTEHTAYAPWRQVFYSLLNLSAETVPGQDNATVQARHIHTLENFIEQTNPDWHIRLPLLGDLLSLPIPDTATTAAFEPRLRQSALFDLAIEIIQRRASEQPLLLMLDDAQWMDEASQGLTIALGRAIAQSAVLLLLPHRPPLVSSDILTPLSDLPFHQGLTLDELTEEGVADLLQHKLGGPPGKLALSLIMAETQGNPFFVEELIDSLRESDNLQRRDDGQWTLSDAMFAALQKSNSLVRSEAGHWQLAPHVSLSAIDLGLPDSIQGIVLSRIDRLPQAHKLTLKVASVIGRSFAFELLGRAHPSRPDRATLAAQADTLETREFTRVETPPRQSYVFKHTVTRDVTYETLLFDQRRQLHRAVGHALEELSPEAVSQLAHHTFTGEDWESALRYQMAAGQQAQKLFVNHEGVEHYRKALACAGHLPPEQTAAQRQQIHVGLGELLTTTGQYDSALEHLQQALALAVELEDADAQAKACRWVAYVYEFRSEYALALEWIQKGLEALGERQTAFTAELLAIAGLIHSRQGNYEQALEQCEQSLRVAEKLSEPNAFALAHSSRGVIFVMRGNNQSAILDFQRARILYEQTHNIHGQARAYNQLANVFFNLSQWPEAYHHYQQARDIFIQTGDVRWTATVSNNLGGIALNQGKLDEALSLYQDGLRLLNQIGASLWIIGIFNMNLGATYIRRRDIQRGRKHLNDSQAQFTQAQARDYLPELHRHLAEAALIAHEIAEAEQEAQTSLEFALTLKAKGEEGNSRRMLGLIALTRGDMATARAYIDNSLAILEETGDVYEAARSRLALAEIYLKTRKRADGLSTLDQCISVFSQLRAELDLQTARQLQAQLNALPSSEAGRA